MPSLWVTEMGPTFAPRLAAVQQRRERPVRQIVCNPLAGEDADDDRVGTG